MGFLYFGDGAYASIDQIARVRHIPNSESCEVILTNDTMHLVPRKFLERSEMTLGEVMGRFTAFDEKVKEPQPRPDNGFIVRPKSQADTSSPTYVYDVLKTIKRPEAVLSQ